MPSQHGVPRTASAIHRGSENTRETDPPPAVSYQPKSPSRHSFQRDRCQRSSHDHTRVGAAGCHTQLVSCLGSSAPAEPIGITALIDSVLDASIRPCRISRTRKVVCSSCIPEAGIGTHTSSRRDHPMKRQELAHQATTTIAISAIAAKIASLDQQRLSRSPESTAHTMPQGYSRCQRATDTVAPVQSQSSPNLKSADGEAGKVLDDAPIETYT